MHRILLIEDDQNYSRMLARQLEREGYTAFSAATARAGLILAESRQPDLILLDIKLPDTDGIRAYNSLQHNPKTSSIPVIIMTGLDMPPSVLDTVANSLRIDSIFCKADGITLLLQRVRGRLSPAAGQAFPLTLRSAGGTLCKGALSVDLKTRQFIFEGKLFPPLAPRRFDLLCALMRNDGPVSREKLLLDLWGDFHDPKVVDMTIARLRRDFKQLKKILIRTTRHGYALTVEPRLADVP